jgi:predicted dehydrogenase
MRIGLVGYGDGGRLFHAPYIVAADGVELVGVVTRAARRRDAVAEDMPDVPVYSSLTAMLDAGVDAVTITTPPQTRRELVLEAVARGVHVVADKPFAPTADAGRELVRAAEEAGVLLSVYHNRRWDTDIRTLRQLVDSGRLGRIWRVESHFDLDQPGTLEGGPTGGLLRDLGAHLVDQALWMFGPARSVYGRLDWLQAPEGRTDSAFLVGIDHLTGLHSLLSASKLNHLQSRRLRAYGSAGSYVSDGTDVQTQAVLAGRRPVDDPGSWGFESPDRLGVLHTAMGVDRIRSAQGNYAEFYREFAAAVDTGGPQPVPAASAIHTLEVLDAARESAESGQVVRLDSR